MFLKEKKWVAFVLIMIATISTSYIVFIVVKPMNLKSADNMEGRKLNNLAFVGKEEMHQFCL